MCLDKYVSSPVTLTILLSFMFLSAIMFLAIVYMALRPRRQSVRVTEIYLSGEGEDVATSHTPSPMNLYWAIIKRFFKQLYEGFVEKVHTGNLLDWASFMLSWAGVLLLLSIAVTILVTIFAVFVR